MQKTKELLDKSKNFIKGLFETKNGNTTDNEGININGVEVSEGKGDI